MHDAVNRGWRRATGAEQYLPGALATVAQHFDAHPEADVVISDTVAVEVGDPQTLGMKAFGCLAGRSGRETGESATLMDVAGLCAESHTESVAEGARNVVPGRKGGKVLGDGSH